MRWSCSGGTRLAAAVVLLASPAAGGPDTATERPPAVALALDIEPVWAGHPVGFCLLTHDGRQYAAYYDANRRMTVAQREPDSKRWRFHKLSSPATTLGWDSHNYVALAVDDTGNLHLSGNMHCRPLVYFRSARPHDAASLEPVGRMVGRNESRCTYPKFLRGADGAMVFHYRDGGSGNGVEIYNVYDTRTKAWRRLLDTPLTDGRGKRNAYHVGPLRGGDGYFHMSWVWRDTPDCSTNHDLCYARSRDLVHWETAAGKPIPLPITLETEGVVVDPVPAGGGMLNGNGQIGFDSRGRVILSYHKFDAAGKTQAYNARWEDGRWRIVQASDWDYRWYFQGGGSIDREVQVGRVVLGNGGALEQACSHAKHGSGLWVLDEKTLKPVATARPRRSWPAELNRVESDFEGMQVRWAHDAGGSPDPGVTYVLRWETLPRNRDRPRPGPLPKPSMLRLYELRRQRTGEQTSPARRTP